MKPPVTPRSRYLIMGGTLILAVALAMLGGYLNELGTRLFPQYGKYVDNVVAIIIVIPMIYLVFVPFFKAASSGKRDTQRGKGGT